MLVTIRAVIEDGSALIQYNIKAVAPPGAPDSAANSHWRDTLLFGIFGGFTAEGEEGEKMSRKVTDDWLGRLKIEVWDRGVRKRVRRHGARIWRGVWGKNYPRLLKIKRKSTPMISFGSRPVLVRRVEGGEQQQKVAQHPRRAAVPGVMCEVVVSFSIPFVTQSMPFVPFLPLSPRLPSAKTGSGRGAATRKPK